MRKHTNEYQRILLFLCTVLIPLSQPRAEVETPDPSRLLADPSALQDPMRLPLAPSTTSTVYRAEEGGWTFNLHSYIARYDDCFWAVWSSGRTHEDSAGQVVRYATSADGHQWNESRVLTHPPDTVDGSGTCIARGVFVLNGKLTALAAFFDGRGGGLEWRNLRLVHFVWEGHTWTNQGVFVDDCMNNYPPRAIGDRLFMTCRMGPSRRMHTALGDSPAGDSWMSTPLPEGRGGTAPASTDSNRSWAKGNRLSEPSWYIDPQGIVHIIFRDAGRSRRLFHSISVDDGEIWSPPAMTNYPDATSKNFTGRLTNGFYYLINNPASKRDPLAISFSTDGWTFGNPMLLRKHAPAMRHAGRAKPDRSFQYPHAIEHNASLWVIYSTNKEDIEISEYKLEDIARMLP